MGEAFSASTSGIAPGDRVAFWNAGSGRIGGARAVATSDLFDARITMRLFDAMCVYRLESTPHRVSTNALPGGGKKMLRIRYQESGSSLVFQGQRSFRLNAGDWLISDPHQRHSAVNEGDVSHLWLQIPCNALTSSELQVARATRQLPMATPIAGALREAMQVAVETRGEIGQGMGQDMARTMTGLVKQALGQLPVPAGSATATHRSAREDAARRARAYIERHLRDPDLSVERVAQVLGCTPRYVHKLFEGTESVSRYIWNRRLELCRYRLEEQPDQTLTALAFDYGFNSSSHFSRSFRERFGTTPSAYLATVQQRLRA